MLKQTITYTDFNDVNVTENLYFNISKAELADNLHLEDRLTEMSRIFTGPERTLSRDEIKKVLELVKEFMRLSYGVRSEDGKRFRKNPELWLDFQDTAVYDAFLMSLFQDPEKAVNFMIGVMPQDLINQVKGDQPELFEALNKEGDTELAEKVAEVTQLPTAAPVLAEQPVAEVPTSDEPAEPTDEELLTMNPKDMTREQLQRAFVLKTGGGAQA